MATTFPVRAETQPAIKDIDQLINALRKAGKEAGMTEKEIDDLVKKSSQFGKEGTKGVSDINKGMGGLNKTISTVGATLLTVFAADRIKAFVGSVISVTSEFQKLEAVLTNTLGSKSEAQQALKQIQQLAAKTPFSVLELSESFLKLANRGVKPTMEQMNRLGDLASTLGKPFQEVIEAILDINNQVRWKEIGIKAETVGNKVRLSFRGMTQEVDRTEEAVTNAIVALGSMDGVMGSMAAISETLGGKISNLGDSYNQLLGTLGNQNSGVIKASIELLNDLISAVNISMSDPIADQAIENTKTYREQLEAAFKIFEKGGSAEQINKVIADNVKETNLWRESAAMLAKELSSVDEFVKAGNKTGDFQKITNKQREEAQTAALLAELTQEYLNKLEKVKPVTKEVSDEEKKRIEQLKKDYAELIALAEKYNDEALAAFNKSLQVNPADVLGVLDPGRGVDRVNFTDGLEPEVADEIKGLKTVEEIEAEKQRLRQETFDQAANLAKELLFLTQRNYQEEMSMLQNQYGQETRLAGDNSAAKEKINAEYQRKQAELQRKQAVQQQQMAIFQIIASQGPAIAKTLAAGPGAFGLPLALSLIGVFAGLLAATRSAKIPKFADGVYGIDGPGDERSDSIHVQLSRNESVVPAHKSKHFKDILKPMIENDQFSYTDVKSIIDRKLPGLAAPIIINAKGDGDNQIEAKLDEVKKAIERKKETRLQFDEHGFSQWIGSEGNWTKYVRKRYSM